MTERDIDKNGTILMPSKPPEAHDDVVLEEESKRTSSEHTKEALYPISQNLQRLLYSCITTLKRSSSDQSNLINQHFKMEIDSIETALSNLIQNAVQALDELGHLNNRQKTIRIEVDHDKKTLCIRDLGVGMTRADLINLLGIGRELSDRALLVSRALASDLGGDGKKDLTSLHHFDKAAASDEDYVLVSNNPSAVHEEEGNEDEDEEDSYDHMENKANGNIDSSFDNVLPCRNRDLGGFYSSFCAIANSIRVGTKSKFDDYYEFSIGEHPSKQANGKKHADYSNFVITRPLPEGQVPSKDNGFTRFTHVRGTSGTCVTLQLNSRALKAGLLNEEEVLKPMVSRILENITTYYKVLFFSDANNNQAWLEEDYDDNHQQEDTDNDNILLENHSSNEQTQEDDPYGRAKELHKTVKERSKYIPLRLSLGERKMLRLVEASMACSDYTSYVDHLSFKSSTRRIHAQLKAIAAVLRGMVTSCDYAQGQKLLVDGNYVDYETFFIQMFEIARRHKIMNPEKMRENYGKLIYVLQDAVSSNLTNQLGFNCKGPIRTVYKFLEERGGLALLSDSLIEIATQEILAEKKTRAKINMEIKRKEKAVELIKVKYRNPNLTSEDIHLCLYSICDNNSFLNSNRVPIDKIIQYLNDFFAPDVVQPGYSLAIISGQDGARLSHSHERQYYFALQSLTLWRDIIDDMFRLWHVAEEDLLSSSVSYKLTDTGQGYQRIQQSPQTYKAMQQILHRVQGKVKQWIGSSVIHLGDHNVPNSLVFIDKYTQVPRILNPIVICLENVEKICEENDGIRQYVNSTYGGVEKLKKDILHDFFKSAFDGSGADNFYDAGSCIDGRLTSAWNWCSQLPNKSYYPIFRLVGFVGFDGEFK